MRKPINLNNLKINKKEEVYLSFFSPETIYLPILDSELPSLKNKKVLKNEQIKDDIYSSVSGVITDIGDNKTFNTKMLVITNDFKEEELSSNKKKVSLDKMSQKELLVNLKSNNIKTNNNELLNDLLPKEKEFLVIKCFDEEVGLANASYLLNKNMEKYLRIIDKLNTLFKFNKVLLLFKAKDNTLIAKCQENMGTFPKINIKIINDFYPLTDEYINSLVFLNQTSNDSLILSINDIFKIDNSLKNNLFEEPKIITISGNAIAKRYIIETKIGVKVKDILKSIRDIKEDNYVYYINSYLPINKIINIDDLVITKDFKGLFLNKEVDEEKCINCSKCYNICPVYINPKNISSACIKCGLCSFYCPSHIDLLEKKGSAKHV